MSVCLCVCVEKAKPSRRTRMLASHQSMKVGGTMIAHKLHQWVAQKSNSLHMDIHANIYHWWMKIHSYIQIGIDVWKERRWNHDENSYRSHPRYQSARPRMSVRTISVSVCALSFDLRWPRYGQRKFSLVVPVSEAHTTCGICTGIDERNTRSTILRYTCGRHTSDKSLSFHMAPAEHQFDTQTFTHLHVTRELCVCVCVYQAPLNQVPWDISFCQRRTHTSRTLLTLCLSVMFWALTYCQIGLSN